MSASPLGVPADLGLPEKFTSYRGSQQRALTPILEDALTGRTPVRFRGTQMTVGSGKTLYAVSVHAARRLVNPAHRTAILTITKPLQTQIVSEYGPHSLGVVDVRGRANFDCRIYSSCQVGGDNSCPYSRPGSDCPYMQQYERACSAPLPIPNLAYWLAVHKYGQGLGPFQTLIVDEAHSLLGALTDWATMTFPPSEGPQGEFGRYNHDLWLSYAEDRRKLVDKEIQYASERAAVRLKQEKLTLDLLLSEFSESAYAIDVNEKGYASLAPIWPADSAERLLYLGIPEVILLSGTLLPKTMELAGAGPDKGTSVFDAYQLEFDPRNWRLQLVDVGRIQHDMSSSTRSSWIAAHAQIVDWHRNEKGIIHTVSYQRAREIVNALPAAQRQRCILHDSGDVESAVERFRSANSPAILVSPAVSTGYDFPEPEQNFQIVSKMPRPFAGDIRNLMAARKARYPHYADYEMMMTFAQMPGRPKRREGQRSITYVLDSHARHALGRHRDELVSGWLYELLDWGEKGVRTPVKPAWLTK